MTKSVLGLVVVLAISVGISGCGSGKKARLPDGVAVRLGGTVITIPELNHWMALEAKQGWGLITAIRSAPFVPDPPSYTACIARLKKPSSHSPGESGASNGTDRATCERIYERLKTAALEELVPMQWQLAEAAKLGLRISTSELKQRYQKIKKHEFSSEAAFIAFLHKTGYTVADLMVKTKVQMLTASIHQRHAYDAQKSVTEAAVVKYYSEHKSRFAMPEHRDIQILMAETKAQADAAKQKLQGVSNFAGLTGSDGMKAVKNTSSGGEATTTELNELASGKEPEPLNHAIFTAPENVISGPVKTSSGYVIFEVERIHPAAPALPLEQIQPELTKELVATAEQDQRREIEKSWTARTECAAGYIVQGCKDYKAPKTTK